MTFLENIEKNFPYLLYYRQGSNPHPQFFLFFHPQPPKDMRPVVERIKKHCEIMNLRFVNVRPFIVDLDDAEAKLLGTNHVNQGVTA